MKDDNYICYLEEDRCNDCPRDYPDKMCDGYTPNHGAKELNKLADEFKTMSINNYNAIYDNTRSSGIIIIDLPSNMTEVKMTETNLKKIKILRSLVKEKDI